MSQTDFSHSSTDLGLKAINPQTIHRQQKSILTFKILGVSSLVCIPVAINSLSRMNQPSWGITLVVALLGFISLWLYRQQTKLKFEVETACHQLGPGIKLKKKYLNGSEDLYQIFQEGHRYYYVRSLATGEKRLVPKDKILQDFDLAI